MTRISALIPVVLPGGGGGGGFSLPYSVDFSTLGNGPLPSPWIGSTWEISSGVAINTPTDNEVDIGGAFTEWSDGKPVGWSAVGAGTITEDPADHARLQEKILYRAVPCDNRWVRFGMECTAAGSGSASLQWEWVEQHSFTAPEVWLSPARRVELTDMALSVEAGAGEDLTFDNARLFYLTGIFACLPESGATDVSVEVDFNAVANKWLGVVARADSTSAPTNYILGTISNGGSYMCKLYKCVDGVYTEIGSHSGAASGVLKLTCDGTSVELYLDESLKASATVDEVTINSNTIHGMFSIGGDSLDSFSCTSI